MHEGNDMSIMITLKNLPQKAPPGGVSAASVSRRGLEEPRPVEAVQHIFVPMTLTLPSQAVGPASPQDAPG